VCEGKHRVDLSIRLNFIKCDVLASASRFS